MKITLCTIALLVQTTALAADWGSMKDALAGKTVEITWTNRVVNLTYTSRVVPGENVGILKSVISKNLTTFLMYRFSGVLGGAAQILISGQSQEKGEMRPRPSNSFDQTVFIEAAPDGAFYFVPDDLKDEGYLKIERDKNSPGVYSVTLKKKSTDKNFSG